MRRRRTACATGIVVLLATSPAPSGGSDLPEADRPETVEICAPARVTLADGSSFRVDRVVVTGDTLRTLTDIEVRPTWPKSAPSGLEPRPVPVRRTIPLSRLDTVACPDPLANGARLGFFLGGVPAAIATAIAVAGVGEDASNLGIFLSACAGLGIGGTVGAIFGAFVDASIVHRMTATEIRARSKE